MSLQYVLVPFHVPFIQIRSQFSRLLPWRRDRNGAGRHVVPSCLMRPLRYFQSLMLAKRVLSSHEEAIAEGHSWLW